MIEREISVRYEWHFTTLGVGVDVAIGATSTFDVCQGIVAAGGAYCKCWSAWKASATQPGQALVAKYHAYHRFG